MDSAQGFRGFSFFSASDVFCLTLKGEDDGNIPLLSQGSSFSSVSLSVFVSS